jgi:four helix bundle protein
LLLASGLLYSSVVTGRSFRDLEVWREAMGLVERLYVATRPFPADERFGLTSQLRRAAVSVPSNIAEGARRKRLRAFLYHLEIALGSQGEVDVQLEIACRLGYLPKADYERLKSSVDRIGRMLNGLITSLQPRASETHSEP